MRRKRHSHPGGHVWPGASAFGVALLFAAYVIYLLHSIYSGFTGGRS